MIVCEYCGEHAKCIDFCDEEYDIYFCEYCKKFLYRLRGEKNTVYN